MDKIRCPGCRGAKKVAKIGGMIGECNACKGQGQINASDKPTPVVVESAAPDSQIIKSVADCVPPTTIQHKAEFDTLPITPDIKIDPRKALYKRKKA